MKKIASFAALWLAFVALAWLCFLRRVPQSPLEWLLLLLAGPPVFILASMIGEVIGEAYKRLPGIRHLHTFTERRTVGQKLSGLRVLVYLFTTLIGVALIIVASWLWRTY